MIQTMSEEDRNDALYALDAWHYDVARQAITRSFSFANFSEAFAFITQVALLAERMDHHPEWTNVWNRVDLLLTTHEASGISTRDIVMAEAIDNLVA